MTEAEIHKGLLEKDRRVFKYVYDHYSAALLGIISRFIYQKDIAEEVLQDVFVKIWNKSDQFDSNKGRLFTWMVNIARNSAIDKTRSKEFIQKSKNQSVDDFVHVLKSDLNSDRKANTIGLTEILRGLDEKYLVILDLVYFKGYTHREAAEALNIAPGTLKTRLRTCINELRTKIKI